jgi:16S rRNA (cytosine1402-N4)-methyltransferase
VEQDFLNPGPQGPGHGEAPAFGHVSVLLQSAIEFLGLAPGMTFIDATVGLGGHSFAAAKRLGRAGRLIGFDKDPRALELARQRLASPPPELAADWPAITLLHAPFSAIAQHVAPAGADAVLADLGVSSLELDDPARGFSFQAEGPLDMRFDPDQEESAEQVVNRLDERRLADVIYEFGEERRSRRIARAIVRARPIRSTAHLAQVVSAVARPMNPQQRRISPATRVFQSIRIYVNRELDELRALLEAAPIVLRPGGRLVVIGFHSIEQRLIKEAFREGARQGVWRLLTKKPVTPGEEEMAANPRARSAGLRAAERL